MNRATIRSIGIFIIIVVILLGLVMGGLRLLKDRNVHYASRASQSATNGQQQAPEQPQAQPPQATPSQPPQNQPAAPQQQTSQSNPSPQPQPQPAPAVSQQPTSTPSQVPVTGPAEDALMTIVLMMLAAYFAFILKRAKLSYRKLLS